MLHTGITNGRFQGLIPFTFNHKQPVNQFNHTIIHHSSHHSHSRRRSSLLFAAKASSSATEVSSANTKAATTTPSSKTSSSSTSAATSQPTVSTWPCKGGHRVQVLHTQSADAHSVHITFTPFKELAVDPDLHWGLFRTSQSSWKHPESLIPPNSYKDQETGAVRSPMQQQPDGTFSINFTVPANLAPVTFAFAMHLDDGSIDPVSKEPIGSYISPLQGLHFSVLLGFHAGLPSPLGPSLVSSSSSAAKGGKKSTKTSGTDGQTVNFAVRLLGAEAAHLVLLKPPKEGSDTWGSLEIVLDPVLNRTGDTWHVSVPGLKNLDTLCYGWRLDGDVSWERGFRIVPDQLLVDPMAPLVRYIPEESANTSDMPVIFPSIADNDGKKTLVLSSLASLQSSSSKNTTSQASGDGGMQGPRRALEDVRAFELDVRTFTQGVDGVKHPGLYLGVVERIDHIKAIGVNTVVLAPVYATAPGLTSLGRAAVSLLSPDPSLSTNPSDPTIAASELKTMVDALHAAGIEIITSVDLTFTAEGTDEDPNALGLRGLDNSAYYRANGVLNCGHPAVHALVLHSLKHWVDEYGIDGFCFLNADNMVQDRDGLVLDAPPLVDAICFDPILSSLKLIASPSSSELLPRGGSRGFPHWGLWQQRNIAFARDLLAYLVEGTFHITQVAMRLTGSADIFDARWEDESGLPGNLAAGRRPAFGFNSVSTLASKQRLFSLAGEGAGMAAAAAAAEHVSTAGQQPIATTLAKTLLATAILAQGTPLISQYDVENVEFARFVGVLMRLRQKFSNVLQPPLFESPREVSWYSSSGAEPEWSACSLDAVAFEGSNLPGCNYLGFSVKFGGGAQNDSESSSTSNTSGPMLYVGINPHPHEVFAHLPALPVGKTWKKAVDTALAAPDDAALKDFAPVEAGGLYGVKPKGLVVLVAE